MSVKKLKDRKDYEFESTMEKLVNDINSGKKELNVQELLQLYENNNARLYKRDGY